MISATEADLEVNETLFAEALSEELIRLGEPVSKTDCAARRRPPEPEERQPPRAAAEAGEEVVIPPSPDADGDGVLTLF